MHAHKTLRTSTYPWPPEAKYFELSKKYPLEASAIEGRAAMNSGRDLMSCREVSWKDSTRLLYMPRFTGKWSHKRSGQWAQRQIPIGHFPKGKAFPGERQCPRGGKAHACSVHAPLSLKHTFLSIQT